MKNSADLRGCYPPRPSASVDNTLLDLQNSSYPTHPHSIIAKYRQSLLLPTPNLYDPETGKLLARFFPHYVAGLINFLRSLLHGMSSLFECILLAIFAGHN